MRSVDFEWLDLADGSLALVASDEQGGWRRKTRIDVRLGLVVDEVLAAVMSEVRTGMLPKGVTLSREKVRLRQSGAAQGAGRGSDPGAVAVPGSDVSRGPSEYTSTRGMSSA